MSNFNCNSKYTCECGKEFINPQSFNGHKSSCLEHNIQKYHGLENYKIAYESKIQKIKKAHSHTKEKFETQRKEKLLKWIEEKHVCEQCGKVMIEKFGSGRFCSKKCANTRNHSPIEKENISRGLLKYNRTHSRKNINRKHPIKYCICGKELKSDNKTGFCWNCLVNTEQGQKKLSEINKNTGGYRKGSGVGKHGWYRGFYCDSSWELAYVIFNLEHGIEFKRNKKGFKYIYNNKSHRYFPDFIEDNIYIEIKGYTNKLWEAKKNQFPHKLKVIGKETIKPYLEYVIKKYGENFCDLYEKRN